MRNYAVLIAIALIAIMTIRFWVHADKTFQIDSESLVVGMLDAQKYNLDVSNLKHGLGWVTSEEPGDNYSYRVDETYNIYFHGNPNEQYVFTPYSSQIGLHGWVGYIICAVLPHSLTALRLFCCIALSSIIVAICFALNRHYGLLFAMCFYVVTLTSAWLANFSRNLYWVSFTWYIPMLCGLRSVIYPTRRKLLIPLIAIAVFIKSACGYEYLTSVLLGAVLFPAMEWISFVGRDKKQARIWFFTTFWIGISCLIGFLAAFSLHALLRGSGDIIVGVREIYQNDILRRTFGSASDFSKEYTKSLNASVMDVLRLYFSPKNETTVSRTMFWITILDVSLLGVNSLFRRQVPYKDTFLLIASWLVSVSWLVLAKSHSFIHTHISPVVWYFAFAQVSVFIAARQIVVLLHQLKISNNKYIKLLVARIYKDAYAEL